MVIQCIAAFPWTSCEKRQALNICMKTNGLFDRSSSEQSFPTEITLKKKEICLVLQLNPAYKNQSRSG